MSREDREAIVSSVQEVYALTGRALGMNVPGAVIVRAIRPGVMEQLQYAAVDQSVTDEELLGLFREAYLDLVDRVLFIEDQLLGNAGGSYDAPLTAVHLTGAGRRLKVTALRRAIGGVVNGVSGGLKKVFRWGNIVLGSLGSVPIVGTAADAIKELKEAVEAQSDEDQGA